MALPPTYYDFVRKLRPFVADLAEQDAQDLLSRSEPLAAIHSVDDYNSRFAQCIEQADQEILERMARFGGVTVEQLRPMFAEVRLEARAQFASLLPARRGTMKEEIRFETWQECFSVLPDPRVVGRTRHKLLDILFLTMCAVICGMDDWEAIEEWGYARLDWLRQFVPLENGKRSHDTLQRVRRARPGCRHLKSRSASSTTLSLT